MTRIAYICADPGVPVFGQKGCSIHVQEIIRALQWHGVSVELFASNTNGMPPCGLERVKLHRLPALPKGDQASREQAALAANHSLSRMLNQAGSFDMLYERHALWSYAAQEYTRRLGIPGILEVNAPLIDEQAAYRGLIDAHSAQRAASRSMHAASAIVAVSDAVASYAIRFGVAQERVHVIPNGVDPTRFPQGLPPALPAPEHVFTIAFVGTLKPWHGLDSFLQAAQLLRQRDPHLRLLMIGDGPERPALEAQAHALGLSNSIVWTGAVSPTLIPGLLASADMAVAPYPQLDNFYFSPLKLYEYLAAGLPVVASRIGQVEQVIQHDINGLLCAPNNVQSLVEQLQRLRNDSSLRARLGYNARQSIRRHHTWDAVAAKILALGKASLSTVRKSVGRDYAYAGPAE